MNSIKLEEIYNNTNMKNAFINDIKSITDINKLYRLLITFHMLEKKFSDKIKCQNKLITEECKLAIIDAIAASIRRKKHEIRQKNPSLFKKIYLKFFSVFNPIFSAASAFNSSSLLLGLITGISSPVILAVGLGIGLLEGALSILTDVRNIKKKLGVLPLQAGSILSIYKKQLLTTKKIHKMLLSARTSHRLNIREYLAYKKIVDYLNQDVVHKNTILKKRYKESVFKKCTKWSVGGIEAALAAGSGYLLSHLAIGLCTAALLSTPVGWVVGAVAALVSVGSFYYLRRKDVLNAIDRLYGDPKPLKKLQNKFIKGKNGIRKFDKEVDFIIASKRMSELKSRTIVNKPIPLKAYKKHKPILANYGLRPHQGDRFFSRPRNKNKLDKSSFCSTLTRRIRSA